MHWRFGDGSQGGSHEDLNNAGGLMTGSTLPVPVENSVEQEVVKEVFIGDGSRGGSYDEFLTYGTGKFSAQLKELQNAEINNLHAQIAIRDNYIAEYKKYRALVLSKKDAEIAELRAQLAKKG
ncbi:hypothetical protein FRX31_023666 [Thalictrum thalictroides]|uniref:Uncharacterized protein n=1 Tax=Thalictrum thalictroides TaxID=46969 RepID=A0A7J6VNR1_THATH|nr:hypothetical protein FRX31_023666 [Thalictrum thalictroides]